ncbi:hypothetical protein AB6A40_004879 [Gnathostoma spinigerum]|uniref:Nucleoporin Nup43 n=1 Tax=Gnathostoma spinigerum TaxID=75299 RepID=A0ABD6EDU1_9BILA
MEIEAVKSSQTQSYFNNGKIRKLRWTTSEGVEPNFVTGSWDSDDNEITLWSIKNTGSCGQDCITRLSSFKIPSDITDMVLLANYKLAMSASNGSLLLVECSPNSSDLSERLNSEIILIGLSSALAVCCSGSNIVIGYRNGCIKTFNPSTHQSSVIISNISAVECLSKSTLGTFVSGHRGQINVWDERNRSSTKPDISFSPTNSYETVLSISDHPSQPNLIAFGTENGSVGFSDVRQCKGGLPLLSSLSISLGPVWEVGFHPDYPDNFYSVSDDGLLLHWDSTPLKLGSLGVTSEPVRPSVWLMDSLGEDVRITGLVEETLPLNSFDISPAGIIMGGDSHMISLITSNFYV